ncbi:hypothetical protein ACH42_14855 [Endozoicomonas sp. (ex Bugula neritina AB1)]|nr:hypothetical protein ACH42_14855 [Endozoicomonas sp. (ex Bugula neritina AB1)]
MKRDIQSLRQRILVMAMLPSILISIMMAVTYLLVRFTELDSQFLTKSLQYTQHQATLASQLNQQNDYTTLNTQINLMLDNHDIYAVSVFGAQGQTILRAGAKLSNITPLVPMLSDIQKFVQDDDTLQIVSPMSFNQDNQPNSWLMIEYSSAQNQIIKYQSLVLSIFLFIVSLILALMLSIKLGKAVTLPLKNLMTTLANIRNGFFDVRLLEHRSGLMHDLETTINDVLDSLQSQHKTMTNNIRQSNEELQETLETIEVQNVELDIARKKAVEANRMKGEFLANMSHEIRTPLNGVLGFSNLMLDSQLTPQQHDYMTTIEKSSQGMLSMLNNILDFSRIEAGKLTLDPLPMNLRVLIEDVLIMFAPGAHDKDVEVASFIYDDVPEHIIADHQRLKQILTNLVSNAVKFTHSGSIVVRAMIEQDRLNQEDNNSHFILKIAVTDTGIGLNPDQQHSLFEAFIQATNTRTTGGSGLGLAISKRLTEEMGGEIGLESELNQGSTFWFTFQTRHSDKHTTHENTELSSKQVALMVPNELSRLSITHQLNKLGSHSTHYNSLDELTEKEMAENNFDLALISTDQIDFRAFLKRSKRYTRHFPVILLTRADCNELTNTELPDGVHTLLQPVSQTRLTQLLASSRESPITPLQEQQHILAVDDNPINLKLLEAIFSNINVKTTSASNGFDAIILCQQLNFDLILMDVQMPGIDGIETTRSIKALNNPNNETPVIAITAHALAEEKKKIFASGMDDYLTKPVSEAILVAMINRWAKSQPAQEHSTKKTLTISTENPSPVNLDHAIDLVSGNKSLVMEMLSLLQDELPNDLNILQHCWNSGDLPALLERVHRINGASRYCGTPELATSCEKLEVRLKTGSKNKTPELTASYHQLIRAIQRVQQWNAETEESC